MTLWEERGRDLDEPVEWRFSLEDPYTDQRRGFASLEEMVVFLRAELTADQDELLN